MTDKAYLLQCTPLQIALVYWLELVVLPAALVTLLSYGYKQDRSKALLVGGAVVGYETLFLLPGISISFCVRVPWGDEVMAYTNLAIFFANAWICATYTGRILQAQLKTSTIGPVTRLLGFLSLFLIYGFLLGWVGLRLHLWVHRWMIRL
jgi:hypothetical protein